MTKEEVINYLGEFGYKANEPDDDNITFEKEYIGRYNSTTLTVEITTWFDSEEDALTNYTEYFHKNDVCLYDSLDVYAYSDLLGTIYCEIREIEDKFSKEFIKYDR